MKEPFVKLLDYTKDPLKVIWLARRIMEQEIPESIDEVNVSEEELKENFRRIVKEIPTPLEFVNTIWLFKNVSRQFTHQLVRTRTATFAQQSMRVVRKEDFFDKGHYYIPPKIQKDEKKKAFLEKAMCTIQNLYREALSMGFDIEDARIILPIGIHTCIMMRIDYRNLRHFLIQRLCDLAQAEIRMVAQKMKTEIRNKMGAIFAEPIDKPCIALGICQLPYNPCEFRDQYLAKKANRE